MKNMRWLVSGLLILGALWLTPSALRAQSAYAISLAQVDTTQYPVITLYVNVRDAAGQPVPGLRKEDMSITEDGKPVEMIDFAGTGDARTVDIVFVFDTTGSMRDAINGVKQTCIAFAQKLTDKKRDFRLGLVAFGDEIRGVYKTDGTLTSDAEEFKKWISGLSATGGDRDPENTYAALKQASQMKYRAGTQKIVILITDAEPHHTGDAPDSGVAFTDPDLTQARATALLKAQAITVYGVTLNNPEFRQIISDTNGEFYELTPTADFTGIIDKLGTTIAQQYRMSYKSPRPTYDGTHRDIVVNVGGSKGGGAYTEQHLVNFKSNWIVALALAFPILLALLLPLPFFFLKRGKPETAPFPPPTSMQSPTQPTQTCPRCNAPLRPGARFCKVCGQPIAAAPTPPASPPPPPPTQPAAMIACPHCGTPMRAQAQFCPRCGNRR